MPESFQRRSGVRRGGVGIVAGWFFLVLLRVAWADPYHYSDSLIGERAAGMGGAFTAISDDPSGAYYNPAGMANARYDSLALSLSIYQLRYREVENYRDGKDLTQSAFNVIGATTGTLMRFGDWTAAFTVAVPESNEQSAQFVSEKQQPYLYIDLSGKSQEMFAGPSLAYRLHPAFTVGATLYAYYRTEYENRSEVTELNGRFEHEVNVAERRFIGFTPIVGVWIRPHPLLQVGLRIRSAFPARSKTRFRTIRTTNDPQEEPIRISNRTLSESIEIPFSFRAGLAFLPFSGTTFVADLTIHDHTSRELEDGPVELDVIGNVNLGFEQRFRHWYFLRVGMYTDFSAAPQPSRKRESMPTSVDLYGVTAAFGWENAFTTSMLGVNAALGSGHEVLNNRKLGVKEWYLGLLYAGSVRYDDATESATRKDMLEEEGEVDASPTMNDLFRQFKPEEQTETPEE